MTIKEIVNICGEKYYLSNYNKNDDLSYDVDGGSVHFIIDKNTHKLVILVCILDL